MAAAATAANAPLRAVLRAPGVPHLFAAALVGRLPMTALSLVFVLRTEELTGSYAAGGLAAGVHAVALGVAAPLLGRMVDARGAAGVLTGAAVVQAAAVVGFALVPAGAGLGPILACAFVSGAAAPPLGARLRALWSGLLGDPSTRHAAFALESAATEVLYVLGPLVIVGGIAAQSTAAAAAACAGLVLAGTLAFVAAPAARRRPDRLTRRGGSGALRGSGVRTLLATMLLLGVALGTVEVAVPAWLDDAGETVLVGPLLALWGAGSLAGGVLIARRGAARDPARRLALLLAALGAAHLPLVLAGSPVALAAGLVLAGAGVAPTIACANGGVDAVAPPGTVTEAFTWLSTGIAAGLAAGGPLAGAIAEGVAPAIAFAPAAAACALAAAIAWRRRATLRD
jgi:MFS transporter